MKNILLIAILFALSGCAGMELSSVSVGVGVGHYDHYYRPHYYRPHYYPRYYQRPVIIHRHTVRPRPHHVTPTPPRQHRPHDRQRDHRRGDRRQKRH